MHKVFTLIENFRFEYRQPGMNFVARTYIQLNPSNGEFESTFLIHEILGDHAVKGDTPEEAAMMLRMSGIEGNIYYIKDEDIDKVCGSLIERSVLEKIGQRLA